MPQLLFQHNADSEKLTYADVVLGTNNQIFEQLLQQLSNSDKAVLINLQNDAEQAFQQASISQQAGRTEPTIQQRARQTEFALQQAIMKHVEQSPEFNQVISRDQIDFTPRDGFGHVPIVFPNKTDLVGKRFAEAAARMGASAAFSQDLSNAEYLENIQHMRRCHPIYATPATVTPQTKIVELKRYLRMYEPDYAVVVDQSGIFLGIVGFQDINNVINENATINEYYRRVNSMEVIYAEDGISLRDAYLLMQQKHTQYLPILNANGEVIGVLTAKSVGRQLRGYKPFTSRYGGLAVLATISALRSDTIERAKFLLDQGIEGLILDTAHFDQGIKGYTNIMKITHIIREMLEKSRYPVKLIAGNVIDPRAVRRILGAGADIVKVGIGPGGVCSTRIQTGVGYSQFSAVLDAVETAEAMAGHIWADGGIRGIPGNVAKALAAGASQIMTSFQTNAAYENHIALQEGDGGRLYSWRYGMASSQATLERYRKQQIASDCELGRAVLGYRNEGIKRKVYHDDGYASVGDSVHAIVDGITSALSYAGTQNMQQFFESAVIARQSNAGYMESIR